MIRYTYDSRVDRGWWYRHSNVDDLLDALDTAHAALKAAREENERLRDQGATDERVFFYEREWYVLSNFSAFTLQWEGCLYLTSEHCYQAQKFRLHTPRADVIGRLIHHAKSAHDAFKIAEINREQRRPDWDAVKVDTMRAILRAKADQHEYVRRKLLDSGDRELIENSWRDDFWGWGPNRDGQNMLGKLWMEVRSELRAALTPRVP